MARPDASFDVIVVLGGPRGAMRQRTAHAVALFRQGKAGFLLLSGGTARPRAECEVMRELALAAGVPADCMVMERTSRTTLENAARCRDVMARHGWTRALVVTDRLHLPRALLSFRAFAVRAKGSAAPGSWRSWNSRGPWGSWPARALYEALGLGWYLVLILSGRHHRKVEPPDGRSPAKS